MPAAYLKDYIAELKQVGETVFKQRHRFPLLIVTGRVAEIVGESSSRDSTAISSREVALLQGLSIMDRVFPITKAAFSPRGPIVLGRTGENDVAIPEYSISKRHCYFEFDVTGVKIVDCGATNGVVLNGARMEPGTPSPLRPGDELGLGRFAFRYHSALSFLEYLKGLRTGVA